ncbi:MAG: STAS domain-containing protein [Nitrospirae bacterium]|nr:MAG: STAS domain-containing protein [Nitrospirota bacterium]
MSAEAASDGAQTLSLADRLYVDGTGEIWRETLRHLQETKPSRLLVGAPQVTYCDGAGGALLLALRRHQTDIGGEFAVRGLAERVQHLLDLSA